MLLFAKIIYHFHFGYRNTISWHNLLENRMEDLDLQRIHPFEILQYEEDFFGLYFPIHDRYEIFDDLELENSSATWVDIIEFYLENELTDLQGQFSYEPNEESCELRGCFNDIKEFVLNFRPLYFNDDQLTLLIQEMQENWY